MKYLGCRFSLEELIRPIESIAGILEAELTNSSHPNLAILAKFVHYVNHLSETYYRGDIELYQPLKKRQGKDIIEFNSRADPTIFYYTINHLQQLGKLGLRMTSV